MKNTIRVLFTFLALFPGYRSHGQTTRPPTNIIIILADDLGYGDLQGYGATFETPNLLQLQREGMRFTSFYSQPQCSPSRAALLTGCYPQRVGIPWVVGPEGPSWTADKFFIGLHPEEETLPELLKRKEYVTACFGKWHLGHHPQHLPTRHGFDEYAGIPYSNDMIPGKNSAWPDLPFFENEKVTGVNPDQQFLTRQFTERATAFIDRNKDNPFFLYVAHPMPHVPIFASPRFYGKSGKGLYADVIQELDNSVGAIVDAVKRNKLQQQTLIIFTSDNGPWLQKGNHAGSSGGLREGKATTFEGGVRVPMIAWWPNTIPGGTETDAITGLIDLLPTVTEITGAPQPQNTIDGKSILKILLNPESPSPRDIHYFYQIHELQAVRRGNWKLHLPHAYEHVVEPGKDGVPGKISYPLLELSLFDLDADPGESRNLAHLHPDIVEALKKEILAFQQEMEATKRKPGIPQKQE